MQTDSQNNNYFKLSIDYINSHRTKNGGFTRKQLNSIGVDWPPSKGWLKQSSGRNITLEKKAIFESDAGK